MSAERMEHFRRRVEQALEQRLPDADTPPKRLHQAMRYVVLNGGKRIRPVLVYAAGQAVGADLAALDTAACAVEIVHAYSLVHDDLPAMDDDDLRRGQATCHRAFDEATAILVGDALQALAFAWIAQDEQSTLGAPVRLRQVAVLSAAISSHGMVGGQAIDLESVDKTLTVTQLENMHLLKTGALIRACLRIGALSQPKVSETSLARLDRYGRCIGLAFQIRDDILDITADTATLGKAQGADIARNKPTYPAILGLQGACDYAEQLVQQALDSLNELGDETDTDILRWLAAYIVQRSH